MENLDAFNFIFSFYSLLLGLAVAVILSGLAQVMKQRPPAPVGWPTILLGIFMMLDITSFWSGAWRAREWFAPEYGHLFLGTVVAGLYYFAASLLLPDPDVAETAEDYETHFWTNRRRILVAVLFCNVALFGWQDFLELRTLPFSWWVAVPTYVVLMTAAIITSSRRVTIVCLSGLIGVYVFSAAMSTLWPWRG